MGGPRKVWGGSRPGSGRKPVNTIRRGITYHLTQEQWDALERAAGDKKLGTWLNEMRAKEADALIRRQKKEDQANNKE